MGFKWIKWVFFCSMGVGVGVGFALWRVVAVGG